MFFHAVCFLLNENPAKLCSSGWTGLMHFSKCSDALMLSRKTDTEVPAGTGLRGRNNLEISLACCVATASKNSFCSFLIANIAVLFD